jgi:hypothetical protein
MYTLLLTNRVRVSVVGAWLALWVAIIVGCSGCTDAVAPSSPLSSVEGMTSTKLLCTAWRPAPGTTVAGAVCTAPATTASVPGLKAKDVVLTQQNITVVLSFSNVTWTASSGILSLNATLENLTVQPIGTTDSVTTTTNGVRVFFSTTPWSSQGSVAVSNPDGSADFNGSTTAVPYFQYTPFIPSNGTSAAKNWKFLLGSNVSSFQFAVEVDASTPANNDVLVWTQLRGGLPQNHLSGLWAASQSDIWAVGYGNTVLNYNGSTWSQATTGLASADYFGIYGFGASDFWAVGSNGVTDHYTGTWTRVSTGTTDSITAVWGLSSSNLYVVAANGAVLHYNGSTWKALTSPTTTALRCIWGTDTTHILVGGDNGVLYRYNGNGSWTTLTSGTTEPVWAIWGTSATSIWIGARLGYMGLYNGSTVTSTSFPDGHSITSINGTGASDIWAVTNTGGNVHYNGTAWTEATQAVGADLTGVVDGTTPWAVGDGGAIISYNGSAWTLLQASGMPMTSVWASSATDVWVGSLSTVLHYNGTSWTSYAEAINSPDTVKAIWGTGPTNVYAVTSGNGSIGVYSSAGWTWAQTAYSGNVNQWYAVGGTSAANAYVGGQNAYIIRTQNTGTSWANNANESGDLMGMASFDSLIVGVGDDGKMYYNKNNGGWNAISFGRAGNTDALAAVSASSGANVWAVGANGAVEVWTGGTNTAAPPAVLPASTQYNGVWTYSSTDTYIVGSAGLIEHYNGTKWLEMPSGQTSALRAAFGTAQANVYVVGDNGVVLLGTQ